MNLRVALLATALAAVGAGVAWLQPARTPATPLAQPVPVSVPPPVAGQIVAAPPPAPAELPTAIESPAVETDPAQATGGPMTLFLTIVGSETWKVWGPVGDRPPRIRWPGRPGYPTSAAVTAGQVDTAAPAAISPVSFEPAVLAPGERPYGPAPQECPRTLPPGSDQGLADSLRRASGCRYLSSCDATNQCTWFYQGRD